MKEIKSRFDFATTNGDAAPLRGSYNALYTRVRLEDLTLKLAIKVWILDIRLKLKSSS